MKVMPKKEPYFIWKLREREASENISVSIGRRKAKELLKELQKYLK